MAQDRAAAISITNQQYQRQLSQILDAFEDEPRLEKNNSILQYWKMKKKSHPSLYPRYTRQRKEIVFLIKFLLSPYHKRMTADLLENVLLLRANNMFGI